MIEQEFPDTVTGVVQNITATAHSLNKEIRVFNSTSDFAELGIVYEHPTKGINLILVQVQLGESGVRLTCSPWYKSWKGSRIVVPNLAKDEAMDFIRVQFIPSLKVLYPSQTLEEIKKEESWIKQHLKKLKWFGKQLTFLLDHLGIVGVWILFLILVFYLPHQKKENALILVNSKPSACLCQDLLKQGSEAKATEAQLEACASKYICVGNAKASCLLQAERNWSSCEF